MRPRTTSWRSYLGRYLMHRLSAFLLVGVAIGGVARADELAAPSPIDSGPACLDKSSAKIVRGPGGVQNTQAKFKAPRPDLTYDYRGAAWTYGAGQPYPASSPLPS